MNLTPKYGTPRENNYNPCWYLIYGNVVTISSVSAEKCLKSHMRKLRLKGVDNK